MMCISYLSLIPITLLKGVLSEQVSLRWIASQKYLIESLFPLQSAKVWARGRGGWYSPCLKVAAYMGILRAMHCPVSCSGVSPGQVPSCLKAPSVQHLSLLLPCSCGTLRSLHCNPWGNSVRLSQIFDAAP